MLCLYIYICAALYTNSHIPIFLQMFNHFAALYFRSTYVILLDSTPLRSALALPENCRACDTDSLDLCKTQSQHAAHTVAHSALHKYTHTVVCLSPSPSPSSPVRQFDLPPSLPRSLALSRSVFVAQFDLSNMAFAFGFAFALAMAPAPALALALPLPLTLGLALTLTGSVWGSVSGAAFCHCRLSIVDWIVVARLSMLIVAAVAVVIVVDVFWGRRRQVALRDGHNLN